MKIIVAPDSFKGSLTALEASQAIADGWCRVFPDAETVLVPMADGGEGTVQSLVDATGGQVLHEDVTDPLGGKVSAHYGILGDGKTAVIEMASASGLPLVPPDKRNPLITTTYGTGELVRAALDRGCRRLIIGIGGSATNDGGAGVAQALGAQLLDASGDSLPFGGAALAKLAQIQLASLDSRIAETETVVACDVDNPLTGPTGAAHVYGPQKGATPEMVKQLDAALAHFAQVVKQDVGKDVRDVPGAGAAGGLGAGLMTFLNAELKSGIDIVIDAAHLRDKVKGADLVITGEGAIDEQTIYGKTPIGVAKVACEQQIPVLGIAGMVAEGARAVYEHGIDALTTLVPGPITLEDAVADASVLLADATERAARMFQIGIGYARGQSG